MKNRGQNSVEINRVIQSSLQKQQCRDCGSNRNSFSTASHGREPISSDMRWLKMRVM